MERNALAISIAAFMLFLVGVFGTVVLPFFDDDMTTPTETAEGRNYAPNSPEAKGREIYVREGCYTCHTQYVREVRADLNQSIGRPVVPGDYYYDAPELMNSNRTGPDLMWVGDRRTKEWNIEHLKDPQKVVEGSIMPKYDYLSDQELEDLAAYLGSLKEKPDQK